MNRLREARLAAGYATQLDLCAVIRQAFPDFRLTVTSLSRYETGVERPSLENALRLARCLGRPVEYLWPLDSSGHL